MVDKLYNLKFNNFIYYRDFAEPALYREDST